MTTPPTQRLTLDLVAGEPIRGTLREQTGAAQEFRGWLELCAALDRAWQRLDDTTNDPPQPGPRPDGR